MDNKHISDEILIAWIEKSLPKSKYNSVSEHLDGCDNCYLRYSNLLESIKLNEKANPEVVPNEIRDYAKEQLGLQGNQSVQKTEKESILSKIFNGILRPVPIAALAASIVLLFIIFNNNIDEPTKTAPFIMTSKIQSPVSVVIENDSLIVTQSINVNNKLSIFSTNGDTIFTDVFSGLTTAYPIEILDTNDTVRLQISSHGVSILDTTIVIDKF